MEEPVLLCVGIYLSCSSEVWANSPICSEQPHTVSPFEDNRFGTDGLIFLRCHVEGCTNGLVKVPLALQICDICSVSSYRKPIFVIPSLLLLWLIEQCCKLTHWVCVLRPLPPILCPTVSGCVNNPSLYITGNWGSERQRNFSRITQLVIVRVNTNFEFVG